MKLDCVLHSLTAPQSVAAQFAKSGAQTALLRTEGKSKLAVQIATYSSRVVMRT